MTLKERVVDSVFWTGANQVLKLALRTAISVTLVRLLTPDDYGLMALIAVVTGFLLLFADLGFNTALVQRKQITEVHRSSVFWFNVVVGLAIALFVALGAQAIAAFYGEVRLTPIAVAMSVPCFIGSLAGAQSALLTRDMAFKRIGLIEIANLAAGGVAGIGLAASGWGVWSLVGLNIASASTNVILHWALSGWRPRLHLDPAALKELSGFSLNLTGFTFINYWIRNADDLLVGRFFGSRSLGLYTFGYNLLILPLTEIASVITRVMMPALSMLQDDDAAFKRAYLKMVSAITLVVFPAMMGLFVAADPLIPAVFGDTWTESIPLVRVFALLSLFEAVISPTGLILTCKGRTDMFLRWGLASGALIIASIGLGVYLGSAYHVAVCFSITSGLLLLYPSYRYAGPLVGLSFGDVMRRVLPFFAGGLVMSLAVHLADRYLAARLDPLPRSAALVAAGILIYMSIIHLTGNETYRELRHIVLRRLAGQAEARP